jgi:hypothetical protein
VFADPEEAITFLDLLRELKKRDDLQVFAWCLLSNHFLCAAAHKKCYAERSVM